MCGATPLQHLILFGGKAGIIGPEGQCLLLTQSGHRPVRHWTSVQLDPETKNPHSPRWNSAGECCVKFRVLTRKPADQIAVSKLHQAFLVREARSRPARPVIMQTM
jgi:hypothetical protein